MAEKTAMEQLREDIEQSQILSAATKIIVVAFIDNKMEVEKSQIVEAGNTCLVCAITGITYYTTHFKK